MPKSKYGKYIVTKLQAPDFGLEAAKRYSKFAKRVLWIDEDVLKGSSQMN